MVIDGQGPGAESPARAAHLVRLGQVLEKPRRVLIYCHMNPDPDSLGAAMAMRQVLQEEFGKEAALTYRGLIGRAENRRLVELLASDLQPARKVDQSKFDAALLVFSVDPAKLKHPLCLYIPKSESAEEARFWAAFLKELAVAKEMPADGIKCMALVEAHPLAYQMEEFLYHLRDHILGLNLGRWDYMASLIHFTLGDERWVLPDRNTIPHDVAFFQNLRIFAVGVDQVVDCDWPSSGLHAVAVGIIGMANQAARCLYLYEPLFWVVFVVGRDAAAGFAEQAAVVVVGVGCCAR